MTARVNIYRDKAGLFRWNVAISDRPECSDSWNIVCQCTDPKRTIDAAEQEARHIICRAWQVEDDIKYEDDFEPITIFDRFRNWFPTLFFVMVTSFVCYSCVMMPKILPTGEVSADETEAVAAWNAGEHAENMMEAGGWKKPKQNLQDESDLLLWLAGIGALLSLAAFCIGYVTHIHEAVGVGFICGIFAVVCIGLSAVVGLIGWIIGGLIVVGLVVAGVKFRKFSLFKWIEGKRTNATK
jgi:hypothetical protein